MLKKNKEKNQKIRKGRAQPNLKSWPVFCVSGSPRSFPHTWGTSLCASRRAGRLAGRSGAGPPLPRRVSSLPRSLLAAFLQSLCLSPLGFAKLCPLQRIIRCPVAVGAQLRLSPGLGTALGTARPGTGTGTLAQRTETSLQITGASVGTEGKKNHREYPILHFCG